MTQNGASGAREAYVSVLGFLSEDAQAALFRYLPYLEDCVGGEVDVFAAKLRKDLLRRVAEESTLLGGRFDKLASQAESARRLASESDRVLEDVKKAIDNVAKTASDLEEAAAESPALLRRVEAVAKRVAEFPEHRELDGLRWALDELKESHGRWCKAVLGGEGAAGSPFAKLLEAVSSEFESLEGVLERVALEGEQGDADKAVDGCLKQMATLVWELVHAIHAEQNRPVPNLGASVAGLHQQTLRLVKLDDLADGLRRSAKEAKDTIGAAAKDFNAAVAAGMAAAHFDLLGGSDLDPRSPRPRPWYRFWG